jgi:hypothetical protein
MKITYNIPIENPERRKSLETYRRRWEDNINMDLRKTGPQNLDFINLTRDGFQLRVLAKTAMPIFHRI